MNTLRVNSKFSNFHIILDSGCSSVILTRNITSNLKIPNISKPVRKKQGGNYTTIDKVIIYLCLPYFNSRKTLAFKFHVDNFTGRRYDMILGSYLLTELLIHT